MIYCKSLNKEFQGKEQLFKELKENESRLVSLKRSSYYKSYDKGQIAFGEMIVKSDSTNKASFEMKEGFVYPVINTTRYMDSHDDVHFDGLWKKSLKEQQGRIYYLSGHSRDIDNVVAWPEDVKSFTAMIDWSMVGKDYAGQTEALIFEIPKEKIAKKSAREAFEERRKVQGSVAMKYVKITMAINSTDKDYALNKQYWDSHINLIANKDEVEEQGYFFGVEEAAIAGEGSLVLFGSNDATMMMYPEKPEMPMDDNEPDDDEKPDEELGCKPRNRKKDQPDTSTDKENKETEAVNDTSETKIDYKYLLTNLKKL